MRQTDQFENHALSWNSTGRDPDLLLHVDQSLDRAVKLLAQHAEEPMLSPLAKEFLEASVDASRHRIRGRKVMRQVGYPALAALFVIGLAYFAVSLIIPENQTNLLANQLLKLQPLQDSPRLQKPPFKQPFLQSVRL